MAIDFEILSIDREAKTVKVKYINPRLDEDKHRNFERDVMLPSPVDSEDYSATLNSRIEAVGLGVEAKMNLVLDIAPKKVKSFDKSLDDLGIPEYVPAKTTLITPPLQEPVLEDVTSESELLLEKEI